MNLHILYNYNYVYSIKLFGKLLNWIFMFINLYYLFNVN